MTGTPILFDNPIEINNQPTESRQVGDETLVKRGNDIVRVTSDYPPIPNVAALRLTENLPEGVLIDLLGHTNLGIGASPVYVDPSDTTSTDNDLNIFVNASGQRIKRLLDGFVTPEMGGAIPGGSSIDSIIASMKATGLTMRIDDAFNWDATESLIGKKIEGFGSLTSGSDTYYINPILTQTNTVYISATGSASNTGLASNVPTTPETVKSFMEGFTDYPLDGNWIIDIAAGTYSDFSLRLDDVVTVNRMIIRGQAPDLTSQPTTILNGNGTLVAAIILNTNMYVKVESIDARGYTATFGCGVIANNGCNLWAENFWASNNGNAGINFNSQNRAFVTGGTLDANRIGIRCYSGTTFTIGFNGSSSNLTTITNSTQSALDLRDASSGDVFFTDANNNTVAAAVYNNARCRFENVDFQNNSGIGIGAYNSGQYNISGTNTIANNGQDFAETSFSANLGLFNAMTLIRPYQEINTATVTGTTSKTPLNNALTIPQGELQDRGKSILIRMHGRHRNAGSKVIDIELGSLSLGSFTLPSESGVRIPWAIEINLYAFSETLAKFSSELKGATASLSTGSGDTGLSTGGQLLAVSTTNSNSSGEVILDTIEVVGTGIGTGQAW